MTEGDRRSRKGERLDIQMIQVHVVVVVVAGICESAGVV